MSPPLRRLLTSVAWLIVGTIALAACTLDNGPGDDPTATPTAIAFSHDDVAVGNLLDEAEAAWSDVERWTSETRIESPSDGPAATESMTSEEVVLPGDRHIVSMNGDTVVSEEIIVDDTIYMRGTLVSSSIYPEVNAATWITFTPEQVPADTPLAQRVAYLTAPPEFPFATVTDETRALPAQPAGEIQAGDRTCHVYRFTTTEEEDEGLSYRIAFDDADRPCQMIREGGGVVETTTWTYVDAPTEIASPESAISVDAFPTMP